MKTRMIAAMTALALLPALSGCGITQKERKGATLDVDLSTSFVREEFDFRGGEITPLYTVSSGVVCAKFPRKGDYKYYLYQVQDGSFNEFPLDRTDYPAYVGELPEGGFVFLYNDTVDRIKANDQIDGIHRTAVYYDKEMHFVKAVPFPDDIPEGVLLSNTIAMDGAGNWLFLANTYVDFYGSDAPQEVNSSPITGCYVLNPDLTLKGELEFEAGKDVNGLINGKSGAVYAYVSYSDLYRLDLVTRTAEHMEGTVPLSCTSLMTGVDSELCYSLLDGIYSVQEDGTSREIMDFLNSDLNEYAWGSAALQDGSFLVSYMDPDTMETRFYRMRPRTEEEIANTKLVSLAGVNLSNGLLHDITEYNQSQSAYRIIIKDYGKDWISTVEDPDILGAYNNARMNWLDPDIDFSLALEQFKTDLLAGIVPDILCMDDVPYQLLSNKGILADLMPLLKADARFDESKYLKNILNGLKRGEKLERIGFSFKVDTLAAKTSFVGDQQWHTADEYLAMLQSTPEGMRYLAENSREEMIDIFLVRGQGTFIDKESMTCRFDSQAFVSLLELVKAVQPGKTQYDDLQSFEEASIYGYNYAEDHTLLYPFLIERPAEYHYIRSRLFGNADITLVGYPESAGGNGGMFRMDYTVAMTSQSAQEDAVLDFILTQLDSRHQAKLCVEKWNSCSLPVMQETLENAVVAGSRGNHTGGNLTEPEVTLMTDYIEGVRMYQDIDPSVTAILQEESQRFFDGGCTAQEAGDKIQSRVSLYLAEQK